jgi:hypothetical protein
MRFSVTVLALFALLAPQAAQANSGRIDTFAKRDALTHGIAGDERYVFVTEPGIGVAPNGARVVALDRFTGREVAALPARAGSSSRSRCASPAPATWSSWTAGASRRSDHPSSTTTATAPGTVSPPS